MIENRQCEMRLAVLICLGQQITAPDPITSHRSRYAVLQLSACFENQVLMPRTDLRDIGLAHHHLSACSPPPIEVMGNHSAQAGAAERGIIPVLAIAPFLSLPHGSVR